MRRADGCILCGAGGRLTKEHIWSTWYNSRQPTSRYELEVMVDKGKPRLTPRWGMGLRPKVLCKECNNAWGSALEKRVAPIMLPMTRGAEKHLSLAQLRLLAGWSMLKFMASEYLVERPDDLPFFSQEDGAHLRRTLLPPEHVRIWIGRYVGNRRNAGWIISQEGARLVSEQPRAAVLWWSGTYSMGEVLLHLFAATNPVLLGDHEHAPSTIAYRIDWAAGNWTDSLTAIYPLPPSSLVWPPTHAFDDEGFRYLADRWKPIDPDRDSEQ